MTNYDYIRKLPPEEMAEKLTAAEWCYSFCEISDMQCQKCILGWLESERKETK